MVADFTVEPGMFALCVCLVGGLLTQQANGSLVLSGVVVDPAGKPISGADVVLARLNVADGSIPTLAPVHYSGCLHVPT